MKQINNYIIEKLKVNSKTKISKDSEIKYVVCTSNFEGYDIEFDIFDTKEEANKYYPNRNVDAIFKCHEDLINELMRKWKVLPTIDGKAHKDFKQWLKENNIKSYHY